jgi:hypothetical protein
MQYGNFEYSDNITKQLLSNFKQKDLKEKIFVKIKKQSIIARTAKQLIKAHTVLSDKIYYRPTRFPLMSSDDIRLGTAWKDWLCPNFNTQFYYNSDNNKITVCEVIRNKISLDQYIEKLQIILDNNVSKIVEKNKNLFLCYSGGVDSAVILSYLIKKKLQDKVTLINFSNLVNNKTINNFNYEKKLGFKVENIKIDLNNLISVCNTKSYEKIICYTTYTVLKKYKKSSFIYGFHGNQSLLHKKIFLEQINKDVSKKGYCSSLNNWKSIKNPTPLAEHCLLIKPWHKLDSINGCKIFAPLGNEEIFEMVRSIDWNNVDPHTINDAKVAKQIISNNVGDLLDSSILKNENLAESDTVVGDLEVPLKELDTEIFNINEKNYHNKQGQDWLVKEYANAMKENSIKLNTLISFILIKNISKQ